MNRRVSLRLALCGGALAALPLAIVSSNPAGFALAGAVMAFAIAESRLAPTTDASGARIDRVLAALSATTLLAVWVLAAAGARDLDLSSGLFGAALFSAGAALRLAPFSALADEFASFVRAAPRGSLVTRCLYARLRHPSELGVICLAAGAALFCQSLAALLLAAPLTLLVVLRAGREDRLLFALYGPSWAVYRGLVPPFGL